MDWSFTTGGCEMLLPLSEQATNPVEKINPTKIRRAGLCCSVIYMPASLMDFASNIARASDLLNTPPGSRLTHNSCNGNVIALNALLERVAL